MHNSSVIQEDADIQPVSCCAAIVETSLSSGERVYADEITTRGTTLTSHPTKIAVLPGWRLTIIVLWYDLSLKHLLEYATLY